MAGGEKGPQGDEEIWAELDSVVVAPEDGFDRLAAESGMPLLGDPDY